MMARVNNRPIRPGLSLLLLAALAMAAASPAVGQTIDYGTLEQIFGQPVTASATGSPKLASHVPVTMEIITQDDIRRSGASSIPDILRQYAGLDVWRSTVAGVDVSVRGYNQYYSPGLLVLVNGRQVYLDHYALTAWSAIPVEMGEIRQIEVVKGPNTALFGFNAVQGVINIITYSPLHDDIDTAAVRVGTQELRQVSAVQTIHLSDRAGVRVSLGGTEASEFDSPFDNADLAAGNARYRIDPSRRSAAIDSLFQVTDNQQVGLELTRSVARQSEFSLSADLTRSDYETSSAKATWTAETGLGLMEASIYRNLLEVDYVGDFLNNYHIENAVTAARVQDLFRLGSDHSFRLAGEYRHNEINTFPDAGAEIGYDVYSASAMWDWTITDAVSLTNAVRFDHLQMGWEGAVDYPAIVTPPFTPDKYDRQINGINVNSGLVVRASAQDVVRMTYGRGLQLPALYELSYFKYGALPPAYAPLVGFFSTGNPALEPTVVNNYELAWDRRLPAWDAMVRLAAFYQTHDNLRSNATSDPVFRGNVADFLSGNVGGSDAWGGEAGITGTIGSSWRWGLNYTYEIVRDRLSVNKEALYAPILFEDGTPRHRVNGHLGYSDGPWEADLFAHFTTAYDTLRWPFGDPSADPPYDRVRVPAHLLLNGRVGYRLSDGITVALEGQGLEAAQHRETAAPPVERRLSLSLTGRF
ncbi:MAG TPA: TonB-dependent receptor [Azospirillaceae bacterium]|nr:TonB-dependent receptor [Azospirillaceae bacterium]